MSKTERATPMAMCMSRHYRVAVSIKPQFSVLFIVSLAFAQVGVVALGLEGSRPDDVQLHRDRRVPPALPKHWPVTVVALLFTVANPLCPATGNAMLGEMITHMPAFMFITLPLIVAA